MTLNAPGPTRGWRILIFWVAFTSLPACRPTGDNLLAIPATSSMNIAVDDYNKKLKDLPESVRKSENPFLVLSEIWHVPHLARNSLMAMKRTADNDGYDLVIILDHIPDDDSISGYRFDVKLAVDGSNWSIKQVKKSWRCWDDRGHTDFSIKPCN